AAVYVESGSPTSAAAGLATRAVRGKRPVNSFAKAMPMAVPSALRIHEPTLIGEVTLNIRSMLKKRLGLPRSEINSSGLDVTPKSANAQARRASAWLPRSSDRYARPAEAPASPPVKKYIGISHVQIGSLM